MPTLGANKATLLKQVSSQANVEAQTLASLVKKFDDLKPEDFKGYISDVLMDELLEALRDPEEKKLWNRIHEHPSETLMDIQDCEVLISTFLQRFPASSFTPEVRTLQIHLQEKAALIRKREQMEQDMIREQGDWAALERGNYYALQNYLRKYPSSAHKDELDDLMWANTKAVLSEQALRRYVSDWPMGKHSAEAQQALTAIPEWDAVRRSNDLFRVDDYRDSHPDSPFINEINSLYFKLRDEELDKMRAAPWEITKDHVMRLLDADIFKYWELIDEGLMTDQSWDILNNLDRSLYPDIQKFHMAAMDVESTPGCTDIYLFGTPGTGKTCLLMGLAGANGQGYVLNMKANGGPYASALQEYVNAGITPGRTFGSFVTTINGHVNETDKKGAMISHDINLVEMSGEEFALRIADGKGVSLADMGTGATELMKNGNRKVFFIIVDCTKDRIKVEYEEEGADGSYRIRKKYISQLIVLQKFISLFELPENQEIMKNVDAIHFIVTKADCLGDPSVRLENARHLLLEQYSGPVNALKDYCRRTKRINFSNQESPYSPKVFTFSLGRFYLGDIFDFDKTETLQIIKAIQYVTGGTREVSWWDRVKATLGNSSF